MEWAEELRYWVGELLLEPVRHARALDSIVALFKERHPDLIGCILFCDGAPETQWFWSWPEDPQQREAYGFRLVREPLLGHKAFQNDRARSGESLFGARSVAVWPLPQWGWMWMGFAKTASPASLADGQSLAGLLHRPLSWLREHDREQQARQLDRRTLEVLGNWSRQLQGLADRPLLQGKLTRDALVKELLGGLCALLPESAFALHYEGQSESCQGPLAVNGLAPWLAKLTANGLLLEEWPASLRVPQWPTYERLILLPIWRPRSREHLLATVLIAGGSELQRATLELLTLWSNQAAQAWQTVELHSELQLAFTELQQSKTDLAEARKRVAIADLAAGLAHELNTPFGSILANLDILSRRCRDQPQMLKPLERIAHEVTRSHRLVESLLTFSREAAAEAGELDLASVVGETVDILAGSFRERGVDLKVSGPRALPPVWINRHQLQSVLMEILNNARWAARRLVLLNFGEGWVEIADDGPGVADELSARIFDPFFTTKGVGEGAGLGLAVSSAAAAGWGGTLALVARPSGACFRLTMPLAK